LSLQRSFAEIVQYRMSNSSNSTPPSGIFYDIGFPIVGRIWLILLSNIGSLICSLFVLGHLLFGRTLRQGLHNHVIIIVLVLGVILELTDIPWILIFYRFGVAWQSTPTFCLIWNFIDISMYMATSTLVAWASIERHILIFHETWVSTKKKRLFVHYIPLLVILSYCFLYCAGIYFMLSCNNSYYYSIIFCGFLNCEYKSAALRLAELVTSGILCSLLIVFCNFTLVLRVLRQKRRLNQPIQWRKHRKLTIQMLSVSSLFFFLYLPPIFVTVAHLFGVPSYVGAQYSVYGVFLSYYITFLFPFACIGILPQLRTRIMNTIRCRWTRPPRTIVPQQLPRRVEIRQRTLASPAIGQ